MQHLQKTGGGVPIMVNQVLETSRLPSSPAPCLCVSVAAPSSILRTLFQVPYPATPLFATLTKTAGVCTQNSQCGTHRTLPSPPLFSITSAMPILQPFSFHIHASSGGYTPQRLYVQTAPRFAAVPPRLEMQKGRIGRGKPRPPHILRMTL